MLEDLKVLVAAALRARFANEVFTPPAGASPEARLAIAYFVETADAFESIFYGSTDYETKFVGNTLAEVADYVMVDFDAILANLVVAVSGGRKVLKAAVSIETDAYDPFSQDAPLLLPRYKA